MCDPVGIVEIAERLEVSRHTVHKWRQRRVMPEPRWTVGGGPCWDWPDVQVWAFHSRRRGRGPDKAARVGSLKPVEKDDPIAKLYEEEAAILMSYMICSSCGQTVDLAPNGALVEHQLPPGRVRHDGSTFCPGAL